MVPEEVLEQLRELTSEHTHRERYAVQIGETRYSRSHATRVPSLIHQLQHASPTGEGLERGTGFRSRPAARLEALDTLTRIDHQAAEWVRKLGEDDPGFTDRCVSLLGGLLASVDRCKGKGPKRDPETRKVTCCTAHQLEVDVARWWRQARITTGWDSPAWRPDNTCPLCGVRGGLRVRLADRAALCVDCQEEWGPAEYQELARHIRDESLARRAAGVRLRSTSGPCWCPWPQEPLGRWVSMCPRCRSVQCRHAVQVGEGRAS